MASDNTSSQTGQQIPQPTYHPEVHHDIFPTGRFFFNWLLTGITGLILLILCLVSVQIIKPELREGETVENQITAPRDEVIVDAVATRKAKERASQHVVPVFQLDLAKDKQTLDQISQSLKLIEELTDRIQFDPSLQQADLEAVTASEQVKFDQRLTGVSQSQAVKLKELRAQWQSFKAAHAEAQPSILAAALAIPDSEKDNFKDAVLTSSTRILSTFKRLPQEHWTNWVPVIHEFLPERWSQTLREKTSSVIAQAMEANLVIDHEATKQRGEDTAAQLAPVKRALSQGELLVEKGKRLTRDDLELLKSIGITQTNRWPMVLGLCLSVAAAVALSAGFLYTFEPRHLFQTTSIGLMYTVAIVVCAAASLIGQNLPQFVPLPAAALVWTIFFGRRVALAITIPLIIILAVSQLVDVRQLIALGTAAGAAIGGYTKHRHSLMLTGIVIGAMQAIGFVLATVLSGSVDSLPGLGKAIGFELFAGIVSAMLAIGSLPFLENIFGMVTPFRLAEITDAEQPLLRQLEENAPGTYQHSLAVANLAEGGARAIGADVTLVRAGALYHDIGKMARPKYFIENQLGAKNPHDSMQPEESRERVLAHVTDGIELARKYGLPRAVQDFIPMHQGTSLMAYFYHKACVRDGHDKVDPMFYRYPGPKPQSRETAIVMLADVSEAVTHSMHDPTEQEVQEAIARVFQNRWDDGQFNESSLTYGELNKVQAAFVRVWRTLHHERLKYPSTTTGRMAIPPNMPETGRPEQTEASSETAPSATSGSGNPA